MDRKLDKLKTDNFIWYVYIFIAASSLYSNYLEKDYLLTKNKLKYTQFHDINMTILIIAFFIYIYFVWNNIDEYNYKKSKGNSLSLVSSILILVAGILAIYVEIISCNDSDEVAL